MRARFTRRGRVDNLHAPLCCAARTHHRRNDGNSAFRQFRCECMLFQNRVVRPATRAVELRRHRRPLFHADLIDAILETVQREQPAVAMQADALQRIKQQIGRERRVWVRVGRVCEGLARTCHSRNCKRGKALAPGKPAAVSGRPRGSPHQQANPARYGQTYEAGDNYLQVFCHCRVADFGETSAHEPLFDLQQNRNLSAVIHSAVPKEIGPRW